MLRYYKMDGLGGHVECDMEEAFDPRTDRQVRQMTVVTSGGRYHISTVFLAFDHSFDFENEDDETHEPVLYETLVFYRAGEGCKYRHERSLEETMVRRTRMSDAIKDFDRYVAAAKVASDVDDFLLLVSAYRRLEE